MLSKHSNSDFVGDSLISQRYAVRTRPTSATSIVLITKSLGSFPILGQFAIRFFVRPDRFRLRPVPHGGNGQQLDYYKCGQSHSQEHLQKDRKAVYANA